MTKYKRNWLGQSRFSDIFMLMPLDKVKLTEIFQNCHHFFLPHMCWVQSRCRWWRGGWRDINLLLDAFITVMGSTFECAIPIAIPHSPPVSIGTVNQDVLVVFLKRQVLVSRWQEILQSNDNPLWICVYLEEILLTLEIMFLSCINSKATICPFLYMYE